MRGSLTTPGFIVCAPDILRSLVSPVRPTWRSFGGRKRCATIRFGRLLLQRIWHRAPAPQALESAVKDLAESPQDADALAALRLQVLAGTRLNIVAFPSAAAARQAALEREVPPPLPEPLDGTVFDAHCHLDSMARRAGSTEGNRSSESRIIDRSLGRL